AAKQTALAHLLSGPVLKVIFHFHHPFWEGPDGGRYADASFFHAPGKVFPTFWTALPARSALLNAWVGGPSAARLSELTDDEIIRQAMDCVRTVFAGEATDTTGDATTVTGALRSGARAAVEVGRHLESQH